MLDGLWLLIEGRSHGDPELSQAARLLVRGGAHVAQKLGEAAVECVVEIMAGSREGVIRRSADVLYHLLVVWMNAGIRPEEVWRELHRREGASHPAEGARRRATERALARARARVGTTKIP